MLTELCGYLKNWFTVDRCFGDFVIADNTITYADGTELPLQDGQYFRIIGSILNDGVFCHTSSLVSEGSESSSDTLLKDETFNGSVWTMAVPQEVIDIANDIEAWRAKYENIDSQALSPYNSESFGGYSYSKSSGSTADGANGNSWQSVFGNRLIRYRKI